jgi:hypothetical protein
MKPSLKLPEASYTLLTETTPTSWPTTSCRLTVLKTNRLHLTPSTSR